MNRSTQWLAIIFAVVLSFGVAACGGEQRGAAGDAGAALNEGGNGEAAGEHGGSESRGEEGEGEHGGSEGGERRGEGEGEHGGSEGEGEHGEEGSHGEGEEGEESGIYVAKADTWDNVRRGARLVLTFNLQTNAFEGTVENTTAATLCAVRVEVHLDSGTELGPTARVDVAAGGTTEVSLATEGEAFETWTAHPELSSCGG